MSRQSLAETLLKASLEKDNLEGLEKRYKCGIKARLRLTSYKFESPKKREQTTGFVTGFGLYMIFDPTMNVFLREHEKLLQDKHKRWAVIMASLVFVYYVGQTKGSKTRNNSHVSLYQKTLNQTLEGIIPNTAPRYFKILKHATLGSGRTPQMVTFFWKFQHPVASTVGFNFENGLNKFALKVHKEVSLIDNNFETTLANNYRWNSETTQLFQELHQNGTLKQRSDVTNFDITLVLLQKMINLIKIRRIKKLK